MANIDFRRKSTTIHEYRRNLTRASRIEEQERTVSVSRTEH
jgi:hypothetical protein